MKTIVAIGGGELGLFETLPIDREIVKLSGKKSPVVLFIPTASGDSEGYWKTFQAVYGKKLKCQTDVLFLVKEKISKKRIEEKISSADIIYVGGGNTLKMMMIWRRLGVDRLLRSVWEQGTIMAGISAGAICWFRYGVSDARRFSNPNDASFMRVRGLGLVSATVSPHHIREKKQRDHGLCEVMRRTSGIGFALDDNSALLLEDGRYRVLSSNKESVIRTVFHRRGGIQSEPLPLSGVLNISLKSHHINKKKILMFVG